jgi:hypothetical protein
MVFIDEYRGVTYSIPHNDNGVWHYKISPRRDRRSAARGQPQSPPVEGYTSREAAIQAAKRAIDGWLVAV